MGFCLAQEAVKLGAQVTIITGPTNENEPEGVNIIKIKTSNGNVQGSSQNI